MGLFVYVCITVYTHAQTNATSRRYVIHWWTFVLLNARWRHHRCPYPVFKSKDILLKWALFWQRRARKPPTVTVAHCCALWTEARPFGVGYATWPVVRRSPHLLPRLAAELGLCKCYLHQKTVPHCRARCKVAQTMPIVFVFVYSPRTCAITNCTSSLAEKIAGCNHHCAYLSCSHLE